MNSNVTPDIRSFILKWVTPKLDEVGVELNNISDTHDLYEIGALDSFDVVELMTAIEEQTGLKANINTADDEKFVISIKSLTQAFTV